MSLDGSFHLSATSDRVSQPEDEIKIGTWGGIIENMTVLGISEWEIKSTVSILSDILKAGNIDLHDQKIKVSLQRLMSQSNFMIGTCLA